MVLRSLRIPGFGGLFGWRGRCPCCGVVCVGQLVLVLMGLV